MIKAQENHCCYFLAHICSERLDKLLLQWLHVVGWDQWPENTVPVIIYIVLYGLCYIYSLQNVKWVYWIHCMFIFTEYTFSSLNTNSGL